MKDLFGLTVGLLFAAVLLFGQANNESAVPAWGEMYISSSASTGTTSTTPIKANGTTTAGDLIQFDMPANNRLRYTGAKTSIFSCMVNTTLQSGTGSKIASIFIAEGGTFDPASRIDRFISNPADEGSATTGGIFELATNEYVELFIDSDAGNPTFTVEHMTFRCVKLN